MPDERTLAFLAELERADTEVAELLAELDGLAAEVDALRLRAVEVEALLVRLPAERERLGGGRVEAARRVSVPGRACGGERELEAAERDGDPRVGSRPGVIWCAAAWTPSMAERGATRQTPSSRASSPTPQAPSGRSPSSWSVPLAWRTISATAPGSPRRPEFSGRELADVAEWAGTARAALFVARASLTADREALIRQANELAAVVLGEGVLAGGAAEVARRVRRSG